MSQATVNDNTNEKPDSGADTVAEDPRPEPPVQPELEDCCNSGCSPCVFDLYGEALARYRVALAEWQARHPDESGRT
ncbi:MAG: ortholog of Bordetella pertussis (BX470248) BP1188A [uncultured Paraburkholderia sp.]|nr:MAG: ortholog of Bordetella pertussis (BX470248) BP1188A [uncultured Paraburkholderia sp.]CAH2929764.1 MAG: ortholog of Bordetella pertussis (BX470248) BP1188A [uncultured Paraburkholderia sp.]